MMSCLLRGLFQLISSRIGQAILLAAFLLVPFAIRNVEPTDYEPGIGYSSEAQSTRNTSAIARLFGELRTSMSDILFIKTERYMHSGVAYTKSLSDEGESESSTVIRTPEEDWRGFIGDLEREVKPWMDPKNHAEHSSSTEVLPWFRLMTLVNPHRIRGYRIGAFILMTSGVPDAVTQARDYISEGIRNNPENHELQFMMVRMIQHQLMTLERQEGSRSSPSYKALLEKALEYAHRGADLGGKARPPEGWQGKGRPAEMEDSFIGCLHYEIFFLRRLERNDEALRLAEQYLREFGSDPVLENEVRELRAGTPFAPE
ncbi:MAG: hypothetical protein AMXMBFR75_05730 [Candidatus Hinthialibacteria bacterium]